MDEQKKDLDRKNPSMTTPSTDPKKSDNSKITRWSRTKNHLLVGDFLYFGQDYILK